MQNQSYPYVLITPARNEENLIEKTIQSVVKQTVLPTKWVIVNDGSTDKTSAILAQYARDHHWIEVVDLPVGRDRSFAGKVYAFNAGYSMVKDLSFEIIGNLDADVSLVEDHFEFLMDQFRTDPTLGVAGTIFKEDGYSSETDSFEGQNHVSGGCQLFRRRCFEEIGGYRPNKAGGIDWMAVTTARMIGWKTKAFRERAYFHHRSLGTAERGRFASLFSYGEKDYYLGNHPIWQLFRVAYRCTKRPYLYEGIAVGSGYLWALLRRIDRPVSKELMKFHRKEQMKKLRSILKGALSFRRIDNFEVKTS